MSHANSAAQPSSKRRVPLMATVVVGITALIVGGVLGGVGFLAFGGTSDSLEEADSKAAVGCAIVDRLAADYADESDFGALGEDPVWNEVPAATSLMMAAGDMDLQYEDLRDSASSIAPQDIDPDREQAFVFDDAVAACEDI